MSNRREPNDAAKIKEQNLTELQLWIDESFHRIPKNLLELTKDPQNQEILKCFLSYFVRSEDNVLPPFEQNVVRHIIIALYSDKVLVKEALNSEEDPIAPDLTRLERLLEQVERELLRLLQSQFPPPRLLAHHSELTSMLTETLDHHSICRQISLKDALCCPIKSQIQMFNLHSYFLFAYLNPYAEALGFQQNRVDKLIAELLRTVYKSGKKSAKYVKKGRENARVVDKRIFRAVKNILITYLTDRVSAQAIDLIVNA